jgi:hypothetical protein
VPVRLFLQLRLGIFYRRPGRCVAETPALAGRAARTAPGFAPASPRLAPPSTHHPLPITHHPPPTAPFAPALAAEVEEPLAIADPVNWSLRAARYRWTELLPAS